MGLHYLVRRELDHLNQDQAPLIQIPSSTMHGMKAPSGPEMHQLCSDGAVNDEKMHQA